MLQLFWLHKRAPHFVDNHKYYIYFKDFPYMPNQGNNICSFPAFRNQLCMICHSELFVTDWVGCSMLFYLLQVIYLHRNVTSGCISNSFMIILLQLERVFPRSLNYQVKLRLQLKLQLMFSWENYWCKIIIKGVKG